MDGALADLDRDPADTGGDEPVASAADEVVEMRLTYLMRANARVFQQIVRVPATYMIHRMFDCVLEAWGKARRPHELEFVMAQEMNGETLGTAEGLLLHCHHKLTEAKGDLMQDLDWGHT